MGATGSIQRVELLNDNTAKRRRHTLATLTGAMNAAATQDVRAMKFVPVLARLLKGGTPPSARASRMLELLEEWRAQGGSRLDRDLDGKIDHPGAAILDASWTRLTDAAMTRCSASRWPTSSRRRSTAASTGRPTARAHGWFSYLSKDLRTLIGERVRGPYANRYCGNGDVNVCRAALWAALEATGVELEAAQATDPAAWRADANRSESRSCRAGCCRSRCATRTGRPASSRSSSSQVTGKPPQNCKLTLTLEAAYISAEWKPP